MFTVNNYWGLNNTKWYNWRLLKWYIPCKYNENWKALSKQIPGKNFIDCFEIGEEVKQSLLDFVTTNVCTIFG